MLSGGGANSPIATEHGQREIDACEYSTSGEEGEVKVEEEQEAEEGDDGRREEQSKERTCKLVRCETTLRVANTPWQGKTLLSDIPSMTSGSNLSSKGNADSHMCSCVEILLVYILH